MRVLTKFKKPKATRILGGALGLLLALSLVLVPATPVLAVPLPPHQFYGTVTIDTELAPDGTIVSAQIGTIEYLSTTVDTDGRYGYDPLFKVPADDPETPEKEGGVTGETVEFYITNLAMGLDGVKANETAEFEIWGITELNLTVGEAPAEYTLTVASTTGGSVTEPVEAVSTYDAGTVVDLLAVPDTDYEFVNWTGDVDMVADVDAADTTITMNGDYSITANFEPITPPTYALTMAAEPEIGGTATDVTGLSPYEEGAEVSIKAEAAALYQFVNWTATAGTFLDADAAETTFTMPGEAATVTANFEAMIPPVAEFSASPLSGDEPLTVVFTDESENMINNPTWSWDFGDGGTSTEASTPHQFFYDGSYTVTLIVTTDEGTDTEVKANYIVVTDTEPVASFTADPTSGDYPLEVSFTDTSTSYDGITWEWDFSYDVELGFNVESTDQHPVYPYETEGTHSVALIVTEADEDSSMMVVENLITVTAPDTTPPTVDSVSPEAGATNQAIDVVVTATFDEDVTEVNLLGIDIAGATGVLATLDEATDIITIAHDAFDYETSYTVTIPAGAVNDLAGNPLAETKVWSFTTRAEGPISFPITLPSGWNLLSTPIKLDADKDALDQIFDAQSLDNIESSYRWDAVSEQWKALIGYELLPLEAVYLKVKADASATAEFIPSQELSWLPSWQLQPGLNLIGPAPALEEGGFPAMPLNQALVSIAELEGGLRGYTMVVSPGHNQTPWAYALGMEVKDLVPYQGYWVIMQNAGTLFGFSTTPIE